MLYSEHMEPQQERGLGCCVSPSVLRCDDLPQHTVTSVNMLKPLLLVSSSKPKEMKPLSLQSKLDKQELGAYSLSLFLQVFRADVHQLSQASSNS